MFLRRLFRFAMSAALLAAGMVVPAMAQIGLDQDTASRLREQQMGQFADADAADRANAELQSLIGVTFPAVDAILDGPGDACAKLKAANDTLLRQLASAPLVEEQARQAIDARYGARLAVLRQACDSNDNLFLDPDSPIQSAGAIAYDPLTDQLIVERGDAAASSNDKLPSAPAPPSATAVSNPCFRLRQVLAERERYRDLPIRIGQTLQSEILELRRRDQARDEELAREQAKLQVLCANPELPDPVNGIMPQHVTAREQATSHPSFEPNGAIEFNSLALATDSTTFCTFRPGNAEFFLPIELTEQSPCEERGELERKRKSLADTSQIVEAGGPLPSDFDPAQTARKLQQIDARLQELASICPSTSIESEEKSPATTAAEVPGEGSILKGPFPSSPVPEDLPPCEQLERLRLAARTEREHAANPEFAAEARLTALQNAEELEDRIRKVATECLSDAEPARGDALREGPFPIGPVSEKLPPCERAEALREALEKEVRNSGNMAFSQADREAAQERAVALEEQLQRALAECERSREGEFPKDETILDTSDQFMQAPFPSSPVPEGLPPCERVTALREGLEKEIRDANTPSFGPADRTAARKRGMALEEQLQRALSECERTRSDPFPSPDQAPRSQSEKEVSQVTVNVKATSRAVEEGRDAPELANQVIRLFGPEELDVALPTAQGNKPQDGHDRDPVQVVTNDAGEATASVRVPLRFDIGQSGETDSGETLGPRVRLTFDATPQDSVNVIADKPEDLSGLLLRESLRDSLIGIDRIGNLTVGTLQFDKDKAEEIGRLLRTDLPQVRVEPNLCRVKEPAAITEYHACKLGERRPPAGARILEPPGPHAELPGARITFGAIEQERGE